MGRWRHRSRSSDAWSISFNVITRGRWFKIEGNLQEGVTATDLVLTVVEMLRAKGVVGKFVEFYGEVKNLSLADRATIANMAPEYGATCGFLH